MPSETLAVCVLRQRWRDYASLAYPATAMRCLAAWAVGGLTLAAGLLPDPDSAVASVAVASNLYVSTLAIYFGSGTIRLCRCHVVDERRECA